MEGDFPVPSIVWGLDAWLRNLQYLYWLQNHHNFYWDTLEVVLYTVQPPLWTSHDLGFIVWINLNWELTIVVTTLSSVSASGCRLMVDTISPYSILLSLLKFMKCLPIFAFPLIDFAWRCVHPWYDQYWHTPSKALELSIFHRRL